MIINDEYHNAFAVVVSQGLIVQSLTEPSAKAALILAVSASVAGRYAGKRPVCVYMTARTPMSSLSAAGDIHLPVPLSDSYTYCHPFRFAGYSPTIRYLLFVNTVSVILLPGLIVIFCDPIIMDRASAPESSMFVIVYFTVSSVVVSAAV